MSSSDDVVIIVELKRERQNRSLWFHPRLFLRDETPEFNTTIQELKFNPVCKTCTWCVRTLTLAPMDNSEIPVHPRTDSNSKQKDHCTTMWPRPHNTVEPRGCVDELSRSCFRCLTSHPLCAAAVPRRWSAGWRTSAWPWTWRSRAAGPTLTCCHPQITVSPPCSRFLQ